MITKYLAGVGLAAIAFFAGWGAGYWDHKNEIEVKRLQTQVRVQYQDAVQAQKDEQIILRYAQQVRELRDELSDKSRVCFDEPDAARLRQLWSVPG